MGVGGAHFIKSTIVKKHIMIKVMEDRILEFLNKVDKLCWEYQIEIKPTYPIPDDEYPTISIIDGDKVVKLLYLDGEGIGVGGEL
jgi:hypothetical protein